MADREPWDRDNQPISWFHRDLQKSNRYCVYCGRYVGPESELPSDKEHLIGRRFVPAGTFSDGTHFNFIFRACRPCNLHKSELEDHVSSISILNSLPKRGDPGMRLLAHRKAGHSFHPELKGKAVKDSSLSEEIKLTLGPGVELSFGFSGPPPLSRPFARELAFYQIGAFYTLLTVKLGGTFLEDDYYRILSPDAFHTIGIFPSTDWGNLVIKSVSDKVRHWPCIANINTAAGNFRVIIKIDSGTSARMWFWALEWNQYVRVVGTLSSLEKCKEFVEDIRAEPFNAAVTSKGEKVQIRRERPMSPKDDYLFEGSMYDAP